MFLRKENCMYQACPTQDCNKKVIDQQNGLYRCEKCDREFPNFKYRMILSVSGMVNEKPYGVHWLTVIGKTLGKVTVEPRWFVVRNSQTSSCWGVCCCSVSKGVNGFALAQQQHPCCILCPKVALSCPSQFGPQWSQCGGACFLTIVKIS